MDVALTLVAAMIIFIFSAINGVNILIPLFVVLCIFFGLSLKRGVSVKDSFYHGFTAGKKSLGVLTIFILIGAIVSLWMLSGTVPALVHYGAKFIHPSLFIVSAFVLCAALSVLIGTSFGTVGTMGVALIVMAKAGDANAYIVAGAIISGIYVGDRCSPMSSSANLVASVTETDLYTNIKYMIRSSIIPLTITTIVYLGLSLMNPVNYTKSTILSDLSKQFVINGIVLLPAAVIIVLSLFKIEVKRSMGLSMLIAAVIAFTVQGESIKAIIKTGIFGFSLPDDHSLASIIQGGGALSMVELSLIVFMSAALTGLFEGANMLDFIETLLNKIKTPPALFRSTIVTSIISSMVGCTQVLGVMLTKATMEKSYQRLGYGKETLALHIEDTVIVITGLVPWSIGALVPLTTLGVGSQALLYSFYLVLLPFVNLSIITWNYRKRGMGNQLRMAESS